MERVLNSRPIFFMALLFMAGAAVSYYLSLDAAPLTAGLICAGAGFAIVFFIKRPRALLFLYAAVFFVGGLLFRAQYSVDFTGVEDGAAYAISGRVTDVQPGAYNRYKLSDVRLEGDESITFSRDVLLYSRSRLSYGDLIKFESKVNYPSAVRNPGGFDERMYAAANGVGFSCFAQEISVSGNVPGLYGFFLGLRESIADSIDEYYSVETAPVAKAMFLGVKGELPEQLREDFGMTGIAHVLAISGLHVGIIAFLMQLLLKKLKMPRKLRFPLSICVLVCYALLTGLAPSVVRAVIMAVLLLLGRWLFWERDTLTFLSIAFLVTLAYRTPQLFMPGFLMSYGVVFGLLCLLPPISRWFERIGFTNYFSASLGASGAASLSVFPLTAYYFNSVSLGAIMANFFAVPLTTLIVLFTGLFALFCALPPLAALLAVPPQLATELLLWLNALFADGAAGHIFTNAFPVTAGILVFILIFVCSDYLMLRRRAKAIICAALISFTVLSWGMAYNSYAMDDFYINILDVGTGDIAHIHTEKGDYLIDNGGTPQRSQLTEYTENNRLVYDFALITNDRTNNIADIAQKGRVKSMLTPQGFERKDHDEKITMNEYALYDKIELGDGISLKIAAGDEKYYSVMIYDGNRPVCLLAQNNADALAGLGSVFALKPAKGGKDGSVSAALLEEAKPECAVISVKNANKEGLPEEGTLELLKAAGISVYSTAERGAVTIYRGGDGYKIKTMK